MFLMERGSDMEGFIVCERFNDHRALSRKYEAEKKNTDRKDMGFLCEVDDNSNSYNRLEGRGGWMQSQEI